MIFKKDGIVRKHLNPYRLIKETLSHSMRTHKKSVRITRNGFTELKNQTNRVFRPTKGRTVSTEELQDFDRLLDFWGIVPSALPTVKKNMCVSILMHLFVIALSVFGLMTCKDIYMYCVLSALILIFLFKITEIVWQLWVLNRRQYVPFKDWFTLNFKGNNHA